MPDPTFQLSHFNQSLLDARLAAQLDIDKFVPPRFWWRPCPVRVLIVVDGLDFNPGNGFGLSTFVATLLQSSFYVRFDITLAHIDNIPANSVSMMPAETRITNRITNFKFDNPAHFTPSSYDVVFLFGIETTYFRGAGYPSDSLSNAELQQLAIFQNGGGGLFATGDHGALGKAMCHKVARARNMRLWDSTPNQLGEDMVSMGGRYRNDTNRLGYDGASQFDDQSDDIPQTISPVFYTRTTGIFRYSFPHPLLCGPWGVIRVMPDHPHEGECRTPSDPNLSLNYTGPAGPEYPAASNGGARPLPEIISYNHVSSGTTSSGKAPTVAQTFPGIAAYDGHRASVGRVVTDATWHHFVNINLTGTSSAPVGDPKRLGFLASASGQAHFENIKAYFRNLAVWLSPPERIRCMNAHILWHIIYTDRVLEAVLTARHIGLEKISPDALILIGRHARDVLGRYAGQCQSRKIIIDLLDLPIRFRHAIDPWMPRPPEPDPLDDQIEKGDLPLFDGNSVLDMALGAALVRINEKFAEPDDRMMKSLKPEAVMDVAREGAGIAMKRAEKSISEQCEVATALFAGDDSRPSKGKPKTK